MLRCASVIPRSSSASIRFNSTRTIGPTVNACGPFRTGRRAPPGAWAPTEARAQPRSRSAGRHRASRRRKPLQDQNHHSALVVADARGRVEVVQLESGTRQTFPATIRTFARTSEDSPELDATTKAQVADLGLRCCDGGGGGICDHDPLVTSRMSDRFGDRLDINLLAQIRSFHDGARTLERRTIGGIPAGHTAFSQGAMAWTSNPSRIWSTGIASGAGV
jgi:hypothetical protein